MKLLLSVALAILVSCRSVAPVHDEVSEAWDAPSASGPILVGTVRHPDGRPLAGIEVTQHGGFATRFRGSSTRTDQRGRYRFDEVEGSWIQGEDGVSTEHHVGVSVGSVRNVNPPEVLPWRDVRVPARPGQVTRLDFVFDPESVPERFRD